MEQHQRRSFYRIEYSDFERPVIFVGDDCFLVVNISQYGLKFFTSRPQQFVLNDHLFFSIEFTDGALMNLSARIIRLDKMEVVVKFREQLPEQPALISGDNQEHRPHVRRRQVSCS